MIKKRRLRIELKKTSKRIYILVFLSFLFSLLFFYSYSQVQNKGGGAFGLTSQKSVNIFVNILGNNAPIILMDSNETYACEGSFLNYPFKVEDIDGDIPQGNIIPVDIFYIILFSRIDSITNDYRIVSATLTKEDAGGINKGSKTYPKTILMDDGKNVASKDINITVIEINNFPVIQNIGVKTIWTRGENSIFDYQVIANDTEDGDSNSGKLGFNISFYKTKLFNISSNGKMYFIPNSSQVGVYDVEVCVNDSGLKNPHPNISLCNQDGGSLFSCKDFSLTVTDKNREPRIINYSPSNLSIVYSDEKDITFNISSYDPDGTLVDTYWYVDDVLKKYDPQSNLSNFSFGYICGFSGESKIKAVITDGEFNDSIQWNLTVSRASCLSSPGGGGGGGGGGVACIEKWVCNGWSECQNLKENYNAEKINYRLNTLIQERCSSFKWNDNSCGFQIRNCSDLKKCKSNLTKPGIMQECYYSKNPNCSDGIKNCHNGSCEILTDCGGPCSPCPTCSDGIKNQNEEGIDCGGVCSVCKETPNLNDYFKIIMILSIIFLILAMIGIAILGTRYILLQRRLGEISQKPSFSDAQSRSLYRNGTSQSSKDFLNKE